MNSESHELKHLISSTDVTWDIKDNKDNKWLY